MDCATKYPVLLLHGFGFRDEIPFRYWGRIPDALRDEGIKVYDGLGDATASPYDNAAMISAAGYFHYLQKDFSNLDMDVLPNWGLF